MFEGSLFHTLPFHNGSSTIACVNLFDNGSERTFDANHVRQLIADHNRTSANDNINNDFDL